jgi:hypothetical protein
MARNKLGNNNEHTKTGTNGDDIISGVGGSFNLIGGKGNDIYIVDDSGDTIDEKNNGGTDHVISYVDFVLGKHIEDLTLAGEARLGTGNDSDNTITGNSNGNILDGQGGDDTLIGGDGADFIDGGDGIDTAVFTGLSSDYLVERDGLDLLVTLGGVTDVLRNVEYLSFDDGVIAVSDIGDQPGDLPAPQAIDDAGSGVEDGSVVITVLGNDIGDGILVTSTTNGTKGLVTVNEDGTVTYQPVADANGTDNFNYTITDSLGRTSTATVTVDITSLNDAPIANPDRYATIAGALFTSDVSVLDNDSDPDGDQLMVTPFQGASQAGGSVTMSADGTFTYSSAAGFVGTDTFTYTIDDGNGGQATATVSIDVAGGNSVPIAVNDTYQAISGEVFVSGGSVLDNDSDPDGDILTIVASDVTSQSGGSVEMNADGSFTYTPASDFTGTDWFNYTIDDGNGGQATASATVTLNVTPPPEDPPVEDPPEYISGLLLAEDQRHNYPDDYGTGTVITYSFLAGVPDYYESDHWARDGFQSFTAAQQDATREMLALVESYTDITFVETSDVDAAITFGIADLPHGRGLTWLPEADSVGKKAGDVWIDFLTAGTDFVPGSSAWQTVLHEIGHTLGLDWTRPMRLLNTQ